jgi:predicted aspartyl protease
MWLWARSISGKANSPKRNESSSIWCALGRKMRAFLGVARVSKSTSYYKQAKRMIDIAHTLDPADPDIQRAWLQSLSSQERIKALQGYLSNETNDDARERTDLAHELAVLEDEAGQPTRPCRLAAKGSAMQTDLKPLLVDVHHLRGFGLNVKLNGTSAALLLDTGAGGIVVDRKVAEKVGVKRVVESKIGGIGDKGEAAGYIGSVDSIKIGDLEFRDCYVEVVEKRSVVGEEGLIGADVFSHFLVDIDLPNGKFKLSELPPRPDEPAPSAALESRSVARSQFHDPYVAPEMKSFTPIFRFGHQLLIPTKVNDSAPKLFLIDTGAFANTMSPAAASEVTKVSSDSHLSIKGLSGNVKNVFRGDEVTLTFSHLRQKNLDIVAFDLTGMSDSVGTEISGILGFAMLRILEIKIDYRDGLVDFTYDAKRWR